MWKVIKETYKENRILSSYCIVLGMTRLIHFLFGWEYTEIDFLQAAVVVIIIICNDELSRLNKRLNRLENMK